MIIIIKKQNTSQSHVLTDHEVLVSPVLKKPVNNTQPEIPFPGNITASGSPHQPVRHAASV